MALRVGDRAPQSVDLTLTATDCDMTTVTSVVLKARSPGGSFAPWSWSIQPGATTGSLLAKHVLAPAGGDLYEAGSWELRGYVVAGGVQRDVNPIPFTVAGPG